MEPKRDVSVCPWWQQPWPRASRSVLPRIVAQQAVQQSVDLGLGPAFGYIAALASRARVVKAFDTVLAPVAAAGRERFDGEEGVITLRCGACRRVPARVVVNVRSARRHPRAAP
jgi:hypothetical protein